MKETHTEKDAYLLHGIVHSKEATSKISYRCRIYLLIKLYTVFDVIHPPLCLVPPVSLGKSWSLTISLKKFILKILELEITSKKIFFSLCTILQSSCYYFGKISLTSLLLQALNQVSQSNIFLVLHFTSDHLKSIAFSSL